MLYVYVFIGIVITLLIYMVREAFQNRVVYHNLEFFDFPASFGNVQLFFISDIHRRIVHQKIIDQVKGKADFVIIGGDLCEKGVSLERVKKNLQLLKQIGPVYFIWGNHDYEADFRMLDVLLQDLGIKILDNTAIYYESNVGDRFYLIGTDNYDGKRDRLDLAISDTSEIPGFRILISHNPNIQKKIVPQDRIRLLLAGHTHGGQIRLFGWGLYPLGGIQEKNGFTQLVSNGYGTRLLPLRLKAKAETHLITLCAKKQI